ncbi:hypothetical protein TWF718_003355 [Orbilia javanica]|uniref:Asteroid domain-containing protein n=1 Tax=Orbilia javanica TaxID=47235 RepID=A0AAN8MSL6_9PEZI
MGIPQLLQHLEKIEKPKSKVYPSTSSSGDAPSRPAAVIDGSALAHYIFNRYIKSLSKDERIPGVLGFDYTSYQRNVINWLERLEFGFEITNIFVDGHLPSYKTTTRISRIQTTISSLSRLRTLSPSLIDLTKGNWNPSPPFLIAAFSAAVRKHERFGRVLKTVPGEADAFCAAAAVRGGVDCGERLSVVFTGDSDLVVYPHSRRSRVAILDDVHFESTPDEGAKVKVALWSPWNIERKLGGREAGAEGGVNEAVTIMKFAWCLVVKDTLRSAKVVSSGKGDCLGSVNVSAEFKREYLLPDVGKVVDGGGGGLVEILDSRAAEVVFTSPRFRALCHPPDGGDGKEVEVYLPVLLEDVTKSSVWSVGKGIRKLAYRILFGTEATVVEVHRKGESVNRSYLKLHSNDEDNDDGSMLGVKELGEGLEELVVGVILEIVKGYLDKNLQITDIDVLALLAAVTSSPPDQKETLPPVTSLQWTWPRAHILSQLMAGVWSLYLLQTVTNLQPTTDIKLPDTIDTTILSKLTTLPPLLPTTIDTTRFITIYAISQDRRGMSKTAKKRARKRAKTSEGQDTAGLGVDGLQGIVNKVFGKDVGGGVAGVLGIVEVMRRGEEDEESEGGEEEVESYMGMTVG